MSRLGRWSSCVGVLVLAVAGVAACSASVSDHDNRIFAADVSVKLSAANLSSAYGADASAADRQYRGRVLEVTGVVGAVRPVDRAIAMAGAESGPGVQVMFHEDVAAEMIESATQGERMTFKCFCEGLDEGQVRLKSCVAPGATR